MLGFISTRRFGFSFWLFLFLMIVAHQGQAIAESVGNIRSLASGSQSLPFLYAGTSEPGQVYKYSYGDWVLITPEEGLGFAVLDLMEYRGRLYAAVADRAGRPTGGGRVYRYDGAGDSWSSVSEHFNEKPTTLVVYEDNLYLGTSDMSEGRLYRYERHDNAWVKVVDTGAISGITDWSGFLSSYVWQGDNMLYLGEYYWDHIGYFDGESFYDLNPMGGSCIFDFEAYRGNLYAAAWNGRLYRSSNGINWERITGSYSSFLTLTTFQDKLYIGEIGGRLVSYEDGQMSTAWTAPSGGIVSSIRYNNKLYFGTGNEVAWYSASGGTGKVYAYDGYDAVAVSERLGNGVQVLYSYAPVYAETEEYRIAPSIFIDYDGTLSIDADVYDWRSAQNVSIGWGEYKIYSTDEGVVANGALNYDHSSGTWTGSLVFHNQGNYYLTVTINGIHKTISFSTLSLDLSVFGRITSLSGDPVANMILRLYDDSQNLLNTTVSSPDGVYAFSDLLPGRYVITGTDPLSSARRFQRSFFLYGNKQLDLIASPIFTSMRRSQTAASNLANTLTERISDISELVDNDLYSIPSGTEIAMFLTDLRLSLLGSPKITDAVGFSLWLFSPIIRDAFIDSAIRKSEQDDFRNSLATKSFLTLSSDLLDDFREELAEDAEYFLEPEFFSGSNHERSVPDIIQETHTYNAVVEKINDCLVSFTDSFEISDNRFCKSRAREIINMQSERFRAIERFEGRTTLPIELDGVVKPWYFGLNDDYSNYMASHDSINRARHAKKVTSAIKLGAKSGTVAAVATGPLAPKVILVCKTASAISAAAGLFANVVEINAASQAALSFASIPFSWTKDMLSVSESYSNLSDFLISEGRQSHYLSEDNEFSAEIIDLDINHDYMTLLGKKVVAPESVWSFWAEKEANITVKNTGARSNLTIIGESYVQSPVANLLRALIGNDEVESLTSSDYYSTEPLNTGETHSGRITYRANRNINPLRTNTFRAALYSGYWPVDKRTLNYYCMVPWLDFIPRPWSDNHRHALASDQDTIRIKFAELQNHDMISQSEIAENLYLPGMSTSSGRISLSDFFVLAENVVVNESKRLSSADPTFNFLYRPSDNTYKATVELFYPAGIDINLHVFKGSRHVGYNYITGENDIGFPSVYSGRTSNPERIVIYRPSDTDYLVEAKLAFAHSDLRWPIVIQVREEPVREEPVLSFYPDIIRRRAYPGETIDLTTIVIEASLQHPLENVTINISALNNEFGQELNLVSSAHYSSEPLMAGEDKSFTFSFNVPEGAKGIYEGEIQITTGNADELFQDVTVMVLQAGRPVLVSPAYGAVVFDSKPEFRWEPLNDIDQYHIQVASDPEFLEIVADEIVTGNTMRFLQSLPGDGTFFWQVRGVLETEERVIAATDQSLSWNFEHVAHVAVPGSDSSGGCFIATAAFGSPLSGHVNYLRLFRDRFLTGYGLGEKFVNWYYQKSPVFAQIISSKNWLRRLARILLYPLVFFAFLSLNHFLLPISIILLATWFLKQGNRKEVVRLAKRARNYN